MSLDILPEITIHGVNNIARLDLPVVAGVVEISGPEGSGKSSALAAAQEHLGSTTNIYGRDLTQQRGSVGPGVVSSPFAVTMRVSQKVTRERNAVPELEAEILDESPISALVTGGGLAKAADRARTRLRAFAALVRPDVTEAVLGELLGEAGEVARQRGIKGASGGELVHVAESLRKQLHEAAGLVEAETNQAAGSIASTERRIAELEATGESKIEEPDPEGARARAAVARNNVMVLTASAGARRQMEAQRAEALAGMPEAVDLAALEAEVAACDFERDTAELEIQRLDELLTKAKAAYAATVERHLAAQRAVTQGQRQAEERARLEALLAKPVEGASDEAVEEAELEALELGAEAEDHRIAADLAREREARQVAMAEREDLARQAAALRKAATGLHVPLARILRRAGADGWSIAENGKLMRHKGGEWVDFEELSDGQRFIAAADLYLSTLPPPDDPEAPVRGFLFLDAAHWKGLSESSRAAISEEAKKRRLCVYAERTRDGELAVGVL